MTALNQVVCPHCGEVRPQTASATPSTAPPGVRVLPTVGQARRAGGAAGCDCGRTDDTPAGSDGKA